MSPTRRTYLSTLGVVLLAGCAGEDEPSVEEVKQQAEEVDYDTLNRNYEEYIGEYVYFGGVTIFNSNEKGDGYSYGIEVGDRPGISMWVEYDERFLADDSVEFWGEVVEIDNVQNLPDIDAVEMNRME